MSNRLLIVDDDAVLGEVVARFLALNGIQSLVAPSGSTALAMADQHAFSFAMLDLTLPDTDGLQLLVALRERQPDLPAILLTGHTGKGHRDAALAAGFNRVLFKPQSLRSIQDAIESLNAEQSCDSHLTASVS